MLGGLMRLLVFRMLPRRILPALLLYDVYRMFRKRSGGQRPAGYGNFESGSGTSGQPVRGRSSGGRW